jgi:tetratricopeptide (TPR) repeat protein
LKDVGPDEVRLKPDPTDNGDKSAANAGEPGRVRLQPDPRRLQPDQRRLQRDLYSETEYPRAAGWSPLRALTDGRWMTISAADGTELYDLQNDPQELRNAAGSSPSIAHAMRARLERIGTIGASAEAAARDKRAGTAAMSQETEERLRALGYVAAGARSATAGNAANPAVRIDAWNQFEEGLDALNRQRPGALQTLERLAREHPESPVIHATAARALKDAGRLTEALEAYRSAVRRWPSDATLFHDLAVAAREAAEAASGSAAHALREEAGRAERAALVLAPDSALAHNGLGLLAIDQGQAQAAAAEFERASTLDPTNASYLANLGNARRANGDRAGAEQAYRQAMAISDQAADAANGLGVLLVESQRPAEAVAWFERALASAPDFVEARLNLGIALQETGQTGRAIEQYRQVLNARGAAREKEAAAKLLASMRTGRAR